MNFHKFTKAHLMSHFLAVVSMHQIAGLATQCGGCKALIGYSGVPFEAKMKGSGNVFWAF